MYPTALNYFGRSTVAQPIHLPKPTPSQMRRVQIGVIKTVQKIDNTAPADAIKDQPAVPSVVSERLSVKEFTRSELSELENAKRNSTNEKQKKITLKYTKKRIAFFDRLSISEDHPMSGLVKSKLVYKVNSSDGDDPGICMVSTDDYPVILRLMADHLKPMSNLTFQEKKTEACEFLKNNFRLNWSMFYERNKTEYDAATGGSQSESRPVSEQCAVATEPMSLLDKRTKAMTATKRPKPKLATERKTCRAPAQATQIPTTSATSEKTKAASVVKRELIDGALPLNMHDSECAKCQRAWINKYEFCRDHEDLLEVMTKIVHD